MRDLGEMGESIFSLWCADAGLVANSSKIDKTGWDFYVEFPYEHNLSDDLHASAIECKIQVKATDKTDKKLQVKLSNLRRLVTASVPTFIIFLEFSGNTYPENAYLLHIDNEITYKVLKRLREIDIKHGHNNFNKRTMTVKYDNKHKLESLCGVHLKEKLEEYIGKDFTEYQNTKKNFLKSAGYEKGYTTISFETLGEENLKDLVDVSLGLKNDVEVSLTKAYKQRFGINDNTPFIEPQNVIFGMPDIKPLAEVTLTFKESHLEPALTFIANMFISPLNRLLPDELKKIRLDIKYLDIVFNPLTGDFNYDFSLENNNPINLSFIIKIFKLLNLLKSSGKEIMMDITHKDGSQINYIVPCQNENFVFTEELKTLELIQKIKNYFGLLEELNISMGDLRKYKDNIYHIGELIDSPQNIFKLKFDANLIEFDLNKDVACITILSTPIGSHVFGFIITLFGKAERITEESYEICTNNYTLESKLVRNNNMQINNIEINNKLEIFEKKYLESYQVVTVWDKQ